MMSVIIEWKLKEGQQEEFDKMSQALYKGVASIPGFISTEKFRGVTDPQKLLSVSYWKDAESISAWRADPEHEIGILRGKAEFLNSYRISVCEVQRQYDFDINYPASEKIRHTGLSAISESVASAPQRTVVSARNAETVEVRVRKIENLTQTTKRFVFEPVDSDYPFDLAAGSHVDVHLPNGLIRQYSLLIEPSRAVSLAVAVKEEPDSRGGSLYMHRTLAENDVIRIGKPRNNFALNETAQHTVLIAGGIGITPIYSMLLACRKREMAVECHYASRTREDMAFLAEMTGLPDVHVHFDLEAGKVLDIQGIVKNAPAGAHFYCCGPGPMLSAFLEATSELPREQVHVEFFSAAPIAAVEKRPLWSRLPDQSRPSESNRGRALQMSSLQRRSMFLFPASRDCVGRVKQEC